MPTRQAAPADGPRQELANILTFGLAALIGLAALGPLVAVAALEAAPRHVFGFGVFGAALVFLFISSTLMHISRRGGAPRKLHEFLDQMGIYLVIAATYTPFCLVTLRGPLGWSLLGVIWGLAVAGILLTYFLDQRFIRYNDAIYLVMGWLILAPAKPLYQGLGAAGIALLAAGGLAYTAGVVILGMKRIYYRHAIWHLCVGLGALLHLLTMILYVLPDLH